jgi:hypothetical protein
MADDATSRRIADGDVQLDADSIERIAQRVAEIIRSEPSGSSANWMTAADVAARYSVSRAWVYANAQQLGAARLGEGSRARLRFDPARLQQHFSDDGQRAEPIQRQRQSPRRWVPEADLIPIRGH